MSILPFKIVLHKSEVHQTLDWNSKDFYPSIHLHPQYQITYIEKGKGLLICGSAVEMFRSGDVFIIGSNVPHLFMPHVNSTSERTELEAKTIFFAMDYPMHLTTTIDEEIPIMNMFNTSNFCVRIGDSVRDEVIAGMLQMEHIKVGFERILCLLKIFHIMSADYTPISDINPELIYSTDRDIYRIEKVYEYTIRNYSHRIELKEVADLTGMTEISFCRFFKKATGESYMQFLIEVRVGIACRYMLPDDQSLGDIAVKVGFNSITNFIKQFKKVMGITPSEYRQMLRTNNIQ